MVRTGLAALILVLGAAAPARAQRLPVRHYGLADGLPHNTITSIHQDRKGFVWMGTFEGLARFDGHRFVTYTTADGLGGDYITDIVEDGRGRLWVGTNNGVSRLRDDRRDGARFETFYVPGNSGITAIGADRSGTLWFAGIGLHRLADPSAASPRFEAVPGLESSNIAAMHVDSRQRVWIWLRSVNLMQLAGERVTTFPGALPDSRVADLGEDKDGRLLVAGDGGVFDRAAAPADERSPSAWTRLSRDDEGPGLGVLRDSRGVLWIATAKGVVRSESNRRTTYSAADGFPDDPNVAMIEDRDGNVWIGSARSGLFRVSALPIATVTAGDRRPLGGVQHLFDSVDGRLFARLSDGAVVEIAGDAVVARRAPETLPVLWRGRRGFLSRSGVWWVLEDLQLCRHDPARLGTARSTSCIALPGTPDYAVRSSDSMDIPDLYEDGDGRVWFGTRNGLRSVSATDDGTGRTEQLPGALRDAVPGLAPAISDRRGGVWLFTMDKIVRLSNDRALTMGAEHGLARANPRSVWLDRRGRLWVGTRLSGVVMTERPDAESPQFVTYTTRNGLSSNAVWSIAEDDRGRLYFGTGRGLDRLDPATGAIRHFTTADGLAGDIVNHCFMDRRGFLWIATPTGLSRLDPRVDDARVGPMTVYLLRVQVAGEEVALPETGAITGPKLSLGPAENNLSIEYIAPSFQGENDIRYQYRLDGSDRDWSAPTADRSINYARLAPGPYRFFVRAIDRLETASADPAVLEFEILQPVWRRWWFLSMIATALAAAAFGLHQLRVRRLLAMERIRRQIAIDLHDDIGAGLAQVAILSEVARKGRPAAETTGLAEIAALARSMRESMGDIVWAIDPRKDQAASVVQRMRQVAVNALESSGVQVEFRGPSEATLDHIRLSPDRRRHLLLILKEAVTNIARHAGASMVTIEFAANPREARLTVSDDGRGFDLERVTDGHGLANLRSRSRDLGADLTIDSTPGTGTRLNLRLPIR